MAYLSEHLPLKEHPERLLPGCRSVVAVTLNYHRRDPHKDGMPRIAQYARGRDYHKVLRSKLRKLSSWIAMQHPDAQTRACVDSAPIMERDFAHLAGLGWFGKNTMLIDSKRGSFFFIGLLLTTVSFDHDRTSHGGCGSCRRCIDACPTGAIVYENNRWQVDARRCISYLTIEYKGEIAPSFQPLVGEWTFGCDVCQDVCPFNSPRESQPLRAQETTEPDFHQHREWPHLTQLAQLTARDWDELSRGSPVRRTGLDGIRRNASINLANRD